MSDDLTFDDKCIRLKVFNQRVEAYLLWREMARETLMTNLAPRIYALSNHGYTGSGFHYSLEEKLGRLIDSLAIGVCSINMNEYESIDEDYMTISIDRALFNSICDQVIKAEKSSEGLLTGLLSDL